MKRLLRDRQFLLLLGGQACTQLGSKALLIVLGIWAKDLTGSNSAAGLTFLLLALPALAAPATGLLVDRFPRRMVLIVNDLATAVLVLALLVVDQPGDLWVLYLVALGYGLSTQVYLAARGGLLHSMVPDDRLGDANGLFGTLNQGMRIGAPLAGAALFAAFGGGAVAVLDSATFAVSAAALALLRARDLLREGGGPAPSLKDELLGGARHILARADLRRVVGATALAMAAAGIADVAIFAAVDEGLGRPPEFIGVLATVQGVGAVAGGVLSAPLIRRLGEARTAGAGFWLSAVGLALVVPATLASVVVSTVLIGASIPIFMVAATTLLQRRTEQRLQGRMLAAFGAMIDLPFTVAVGVGAAVVAVVDFRVLYAVNAVVFAAAGLRLLAGALPAGRAEPVPADSAGGGESR